MLNNLFHKKNNKSFFNHFLSERRYQERCGGKLKTSRGFALVEVIVSVALFSIVMTVGIGSLLSMVSANKKSQSLKVVVNNINLAVEGLSKEIRVGYGYNCDSITGGDCINGSDSIYFTSKNGEAIIYALNSGAIQKKVGTGVFNNMTAPDVTISDLRFYVLGSSPTDSIQPRVIIIVRGYKGDRVKDKLEFDLQTVVTQRLLDF